MFRCGNESCSKIIHKLLQERDALILSRDGPSCRDITSAPDRLTEGRVSVEETREKSDHAVKSASDESVDLLKINTGSRCLVTLGRLSNKAVISQCVIAERMTPSR